jgi:hypothetical protein
MVPERTHAGHALCARQSGADYKNESIAQVLLKQFL